MTSKRLLIPCIFTFGFVWYKVIRELTEKQNEPSLVEFRNMSMITGSELDIFSAQEQYKKVLSPFMLVVYGIPYNAYHIPFTYGKL